MDGFSSWGKRILIKRIKIIVEKKKIIFFQFQHIFFSNLRKGFEATGGSFRENILRFRLRNFGFFFTVGYFCLPGYKSKSWSTNPIGSGSYTLGVKMWEFCSLNNRNLDQNPDLTKSLDWVYGITNIHQVQEVKTVLKCSKIYIYVCLLTFYIIFTGMLPTSDY